MNLAVNMLEHFTEEELRKKKPSELVILVLQFQKERDKATIMATDAGRREAGCMEKIRIHEGYQHTVNLALAKGK